MRVLSYAWQHLLDTAHELLLLRVKLESRHAPRTTILDPVERPLSEPLPKTTWVHVQELRGLFESEASVQQHLEGDLRLLERTGPVALALDEPRRVEH